MGFFFIVFFFFFFFLDAAYEITPVSAVTNNPLPTITRADRSCIANIFSVLVWSFFLWNDKFLCMVDSCVKTEGFYGFFGSCVDFRYVKKKRKEQEVDIYIYDSKEGLVGLANVCNDYG